MATFVCIECRTTKTVKTDGGTGYATFTRGKRGKVCYSCCAIRDQASMRKTGRATLYWNDTGRTVTNWPGTLSLGVTRVAKGRHNIAGTRTDVWFRSNGQAWHGVTYGENTQLLHSHRIAKAGL
jgi:hypothetical protein